MAEISGNIQLDDVVFGPPPPPQSFLHSAQQLMVGAEVLVASGTEIHNAVVLVCGFVAEAALKAVISKGARPEKAWGHDLLGLWVEAKKVAGLPPPPEWVAQLQVFHYMAPEPDKKDTSAEGIAKRKHWEDSKFFIRYCGGSHMYCLPPVKAVMAGLRALLSIAAGA